MINNRIFFILLSFAFNICCAQFIYTNYQEADYWRITNNHQQEKTSSDSLSSWAKYKMKKKKFDIAKIIILVFLLTYITQQDQILYRISLI